MREGCIYIINNLNYMNLTRQISENIILDLIKITGAPQGKRVIIFIDDLKLPVL